MEFTSEQAEFYERNGYICIPDLFDACQIQAMRHEIDRLSVPEGRGVVLEENGLIRALHGCHQESDLFDDLVRDPQLLAPARQIINEPLYVYQFKVNIKQAFGGDVWPWHQDYIFWNKEDGVKRDCFLNAAVFVDDTTEFNSPLLFIPGSHRRGMIDVAPNTRVEGWQAGFSANLKYTVPNQMVAEMEAENGIVAPKGRAGSVLFFHPNVIHGSVPNISPSPRRLVIITYNAVTNTPTNTTRPEFLISRDYAAIG